MTQTETLVCQVCGRATPPRADKYWLVGPWRSHPEYNIIRCPAHWSEWALRNSIGRSWKNRIRAREAREWSEARPQMSPFLEPFVSKAPD